jgi:glycosyltransferase involved in cell wall biosynthesis
VKRVIFTVINDLAYDQRMQRICNTLAEKGYHVTLVGRKQKNLKLPQHRAYKQKRLHCFFENGFLLYASYNICLTGWLLFQKIDIICAIDLDTILPCYFVSILRGKKRVYDAHELFTEQKEIITRPAIHKVWLLIEKFAVPKFKYGYTVSESIANELTKRYKVQYAVIRNVPRKIVYEHKNLEEKFILYQGAVNEARGLENLIVAMHHVDASLYIVGNGNIFENITKLIKENNLESKVIIKEMLPPHLLLDITNKAYIGVNLVEPIGLNQLYSLANKFFDYIQTAVPQLTMNFPEYKKINEEFEVALLAETIDVNEIAQKLNLLLDDNVLYEKLKANCLKAKEIFNWENEEIKLINFYQQL